ncbi:MAG TPA: DnaJ domain-containing protein, partial [Thermoanaerobaculia bacterium]|nr:DnaJ domain-containing protein [Thermoanaerobaculia bacterium]
MTSSEAYRLLEVTPDAPDEDVRRAWRDLTKVWHPDRFAHDAELQRRAQEKLKEINAAYETILDARARGEGAENRAHSDEA